MLKISLLTLNTCLAPIVFTGISLSRAHLLTSCTNSFLPRRQSFPKTFQRTPSQRRTCLLPDASVSGSRCGRASSQIRLRLVPRSPTSRGTLAREMGQGALLGCGDMKKRQASNTMLNACPFIGWKTKKFYFLYLSKPPLRNLTKCSTLVSKV